MGCVAVLVIIRVYEEDRLLENTKKMGNVLKRLLRDLASRHLELVRNRRTREHTLVQITLERQGAMHVGK